MIYNNPAFLQALEDVCDEEYESYLEALETRESHTFSQKHNKKMQKLIKRQQKPYYVMISTAGRRAACIAAAVIILSASALSVKAVREAVFDFITHIFSDHTVVTTDSGTDAGYPDTIEKEYYIPALPEGFEETAKTKTDNAIHLAYFNNDVYVLFTQCIKSKYNTNYDNEPIDVYVNGIRKKDYTIVQGTNMKEVQFNAGLTAGDDVDITYIKLTVV